MKEDIFTSNQNDFGKVFSPQLTYFNSWILLIPNPKVKHLYLKPYGLANMRLKNKNFIEMEAPSEEWWLINLSCYLIIKKPNGFVNLKISPLFGNQKLNKLKASSLASLIGKAICEKS